MKANFAAMICNFIAALAWIVASVLFFMQNSRFNGIVFLCLAIAQTAIGCLNLSGYRREKARQDSKKAEEDN